MKKFLMISVLYGLSGCASLPFMGPPASTAPATPVFFQTFSAALDQSAISTIASAAKTANQKPNARITVIGAADGVGSARANKYLSETRAQVVADALVADGVAAERIHIRGMGIAPSAVAAGTPAQSSRRVLIEISD